MAVLGDLQVSVLFLGAVSGILGVAIVSLPYLATCAAGDLHK